MEIASLAMRLLLVVGREERKEWNEQSAKRNDLHTTGQGEGALKTTADRAGAGVSIRDRGR